MENVLEKSPHLSNLSHISKLIQGEIGRRRSTDLIPNEIASMKFFPIVSVDVEKSFSVYRSILNDQRQRLTEENLEKIMITHAFYNRNNKELFESLRFASIFF